MSERDSTPGTSALRDAKREMLARLLAEAGLSEPAGSRIPRRAEGAAVPLSHAQELIWLLDRATPGLIAYNSVAAWRLTGKLDLPALSVALDWLSARHEALRTRFPMQGSHPVQMVDPPGSAQLVIEDFRSVLDGEARSVAADAELRRQARRPFDLEQEHQFRPVLVRVSEEESRLLLLTHHIVSDAWSYGVMVRELSALYNAIHAGRSAGLPDLPIQFGDFAAWERTELTGERLQERLKYWRETLLPAEAELRVPTDRPRPTAPSFEGGRALSLVPTVVLERLRAVAVQEGATLYMVLLAAYQTLLHRWSEQDDVVTGSAIAGRTRSETEGVIGYFSGALPLRTRFLEGDSFRSLLRRVRATVLGALEHQDVPIEALVRELQEQGRSGHAPLFQAVLTMQDTIGARLELDGLTCAPLEIQSGTTKFELTLLPTERADGLELLLWYRSDLFDLPTAERFLGHLGRLLEEIAGNPDRSVEDYALLTAAEERELDTWNAPAAIAGEPTTITALIQRAALRAPKARAVISGEQTLSWNELITQGNRLAHRLQALHVGPDVPVGLCLERSVDLIVGMYGILAAGGAYVPLLPDQPPARIAKQLEECGAKVVVTSAAASALLPAGIETVALDRDRAALDSLPASAPESAAGPDSLAYVLFTSGSTGVPKGVAVTHANLVHYTRAIASVLGLDLEGGSASWHCGSVSTLAADLGHTSVFPALASGGTLHLLASDILMDPARFQAYVGSHPLDLLKITPSHFQALAGADPAPEHLPRRWLVLGGEACPWSLTDKVRQANQCRVLNHYGPTETTVGACTFEVGSKDLTRFAPATVPIGLPLPGVQAEVFDRHGRRTPVGVPGELWIGGAGVARGYLGRDQLTRERFQQRNDGRFYRTGDRVQRLPTGDLEFLGRLDQQVKVRGHRVELGEIEAALATHPAVRQAVVILSDETLTGFVVGGPEATDQALTGHLRALLPDHMIPSAWVRLERLPLNANGKVDRAALRAPAPVEASGEGAPRNETERKLAELWADVLKRPRVGIHENFFALGGHSLLAIRLLGRIAKAFGPKLPLRTLFEKPTIAQLAESVAPTHPLETPLAALWAEVLKKPQVGRDENFFALGGHSLLAIRLLGRIAKAFGPKLPLRVLFEHPTVAQLAPVISVARDSGGAR